VVYSTPPRKRTASRLTRREEVISYPEEVAHSCKILGVTHDR